MTYKAVLFDLDGTILDTREDIGGAMNRVLADRGLATHPIEEYGTFLGSGARALVVSALPEYHRDEATISESLEAFRQYYGQNCTVKTEPYPGIPELLDELVVRNIKLGILTNKPHAITLVCVSRLLANWPFGVVIGHREGQPPKPNPRGALEAARAMSVAPDDTIFLGDTKIDMETALGAGMFPVGVAWGFREADDLVEGGARAIVRHPLDLLKYLRKDYSEQPSDPSS